MIYLILGLILFLGTHSVRVFADSWRARTIARLGEGPWKGVYSVLSLVGFALIVWGYGQARLEPVVLWSTPLWTRHLAALGVLIALVLLAAAYVPGNGLKAKVKHPMVLGVKVWAFSHLVANNTLADVLLFGGFLAWAIADFASARRRDRAAGTVYPPGRFLPSMLVGMLGVGLWAFFAFWAHAAWFGVRPFG